ncbi:MAG: tRNA (adenosine(37)-N6)-dimethylallyltransferase MiaA [Ruminococcaceae bacterium]|nr:tRNA (adenosine(37)-N6)-dimethylallyltransferase MiaA [Oscillospiraceae bacterium]
MKKTEIIVVTGPTASGKSALAERLALEKGGEIVSCDSMQIYRGLDIGTAKPTKEEQERVRYHMIDIVDVEDEYSCADFVVDAKKAIADIESRGKLPILCGGTGLYIENILYPTDFSTAGSDEEYRKSLEVYSNHELYQMLLEVDPKSAEGNHENNRKRVARALEIYHLTGIPKSQWDQQSRTRESEYIARHISLVASDRDYLYDRINRRVDLMISQGLVEEARKLDFEKCKTAGQAIGYKELRGYLEGGISLEEAVENLKRSTRNYAKRQLTWFSRYKNAEFIDICEKVFQ